MSKTTSRQAEAPNRRTMIQWIVVSLLSISGLVTTLTGIYLLFAPSGGYQGGRNPHYGETFLFNRHTWVDFHIWAGIIMVAVSLVHIALHWKWIAEMSRRTLAVLLGRRKPFNRKIWARVGVLAAIGLVFIGVAASGIYFFVFPGGRGGGQTIQFLFTRSTWDSIHTWTGIFMILVGVVHLSQRWKWVTRVTLGVAGTLVSRRQRIPESTYA